MQDNSMNKSIEHKRVWKNNQGFGSLTDEKSNRPLVNFHTPSGNIIESFAIPWEGCGINAIAQRGDAVYIYADNKPNEVQQRARIYTNPDATELVVPTIEGGIYQSDGLYYAENAEGKRCRINAKGDYRAAAWPSEYWLAESSVREMAVFCGREAVTKMRRIEAIGEIFEVASYIVFVDSYTNRLVYFDKMHPGRIQCAKIGVRFRRVWDIAFDGKQFYVIGRLADSLGLIRIDAQSGKLRGDMLEFSPPGWYACFSAGAKSLILGDGRGFALPEHIEFRW